MLVERSQIGSTQHIAVEKVADPDLVRDPDEVICVARLLIRFMY